MAQLDDFVRSVAQSGARAGEQLMWCGVVQRYASYNALGNPVGDVTHYWGIATDQRFILLHAPAALTGGLKLENGGLHEEWQLDDLGQLPVKWFGGLHKANAIFLTPKPGLGPHGGDSRRYDIKQSFSGCDGQHAFCHEFPSWLSQRLGGPAIAPPAARAKESGPKKSKAPLAIGCLGGLLLLGAAGAGAGAYSNHSDAQAADQRATRDERNAAQETANPGLAETLRDRAARDRRTQESRQSAATMFGGAAAGLALFGLVGLGASVVVGRRRPEGG